MEISPSLSRSEKRWWTAWQEQLRLSAWSLILLEARLNGKRTRTKKYRHPRRGLGYFIVRYYDCTTMPFSLTVTQRRHWRLHCVALVFGNVKTRRLKGHQAQVCSPIVKDPF